jgi:hypothetical protein
VLSRPSRHSCPKGEFPSSHHREEGWPSNQENIAQHPLSLGRGGAPIEGTRDTSPAASIRKLRAIFLVTPPPLLAVMRGEEFAFSKSHSKPNIVVLAVLEL